MKWSAKDAASAVGGKIVQGEPGRIARGISTDTRMIDAGDGFIALMGEHFDGRDFVNDADARGAAWVMVQKGGKGSFPAGTTIIEVEDTLEALGKLAAKYRRGFKIKAVAVTGSVGKSTTKELIAAILGSEGTVLKNEGNFNNRIGLPLSLFRLRNTHKIAVLEMGCNEPGEIEKLMKIARPEVGLITMVAPVHLEGLGSLAGVAKAKAEMIRGLRANDTFIQNLDDPMIAKHIKGFKGKIIGFSAGADARFKGESLHLMGLEKDVRGGKPLVRFHIQRRKNGKDMGKQVEFELNTLSRHNAVNVLAACAMGRAFRVSLEDACSRLKGFRGLDKRGEVARSKKGFFVIDDTYNASPVSVANALETLAWWKGPMRGAAVLGEMMELGSYARKYHRETGKKAAKSGIEILVARGPHAKDMRKGAIEGGLSKNCVFVAKTNSEAAAYVRKRIEKGNWVLVKGSRAMGMETVVKTLLN